MVLLIERPLRLQPNIHHFTFLHLDLVETEAFEERFGVLQDSRSLTFFGLAVVLMLSVTHDLLKQVSLLGPLAPSSFT